MQMEHIFRLLIMMLLPPSALQVPHDASVKVSFDTLQIIDDISVPHGNWGKASYLEPITTDFPQFGSGGATQVITHSRIKIKSITKQMVGRVNLLML